MSTTVAESGVVGSLSILLLEDNPTDALLLEQELQDAFRPVAQIEVVTRLEEAIALAHAREFDVCLLDLNVPDSSGLATFERMRAEAQALPLIVFTGAHDERIAARILQSGAQDYVVKQVGMGPLLTRALRFAIERNKVQVEFARRDAQLLRSENQIRRIIEASADAMIVVDGAGLVRFVNPAAETMFGRTARELIGRDFGFPMLTGQAAEIDLVRSDHSTLIAEMRAVDVMWEEKPALLASLRDVTERKRETEVLEIRAQLATLSADIGSALAAASTSLSRGLQLTAEVLIRHMDISFARVWTLDEAAQHLILEAAAGTSFDADHSEVRVPLGGFLVGRIAQSREPYATNDVANDPNIGNPDWAKREGLVSFAGYPIGVDERTVGVLVVFGRKPFAASVLSSLASESKKIGEFIARKSAEIQLIRAKERAEAAGAAIRDSSEQLNLALGASRTGIWTWDAIADKVSWDDRAQEMFGIPPGGFGGTFGEVLAVVHPEDRDSIAGVASNGSSDFEIEFRVILSSGRARHLVSRGRRYHDESGRRIRLMGTAQDVTEQRLLEEQLRQSQKMDAIGQLAGGIAHDFNNVLNVITGYSQLLLRTVKTGDPIYHKIQEIRDAGDRAAALTRQLLAFSRKQILKPRVLNLADVLRDIDHMVRRLIGEDVEIFTDIGQNLGNVKVDPSQLEQVVLNLVVNARDAMPRGGKLTLALSNTETDRGVRDGPRAHYVLFSVSDSGCGMTPEVQARVFEPFFTTKEFGKGTGLGLSTVYGIVQQSGGYIKLYSEPGVGTSFKIFLPKVDEAGEPLVREGPLTLMGGEETILLVEDDAAVREQVAETLVSVGYKVIPARDGTEAALLSDGYSEKIHLLLTDVIMPKMGGPEIASRLIVSRPGIKVLYMSGYAGNAIDNNGILGRDAPLLEKPFTPEALCGAVRAVVGPLSPALRILVVDDVPAIRDWLRTILSESGYFVCTAANGRDARKQHEIEHFDLVITDLVMPEEEGIETIMALRRKAPQLKIIAISGGFGRDALDAAKILGANMSLTKPFSEDTVLRSVREVMAGAKH